MCARRACARAPRRPLPPAWPPGRDRIPAARPPRARPPPCWPAPAPPHRLVDVPGPIVLVVRRLRPLPGEMVVRGYLTGSLWRDHQAGRGAKPYGIQLDPKMRKDEKFPAPILTPSTKEEVGKHDQPIS